jgi:hypothetical protein
MIVWGSVMGATNTSPVPSDLVLWQNGTVRTLESGAPPHRARHLK